MTERRAVRRYALCLALSVAFGTPFGEDGIQKQRGKTRNISTRGVYMILDRAVSPETDVDLNVVLPTGTSDGTRVVVRAAGKVVRVEEWSVEGSRRVGVAITIRRYEIVRIEPAVSSSMRV